MPEQFLKKANLPKKPSLKTLHKALSKSLTEEQKCPLQTELNYKKGLLLMLQLKELSMNKQFDQLSKTA